MDPAEPGGESLSGLLEGILFGPSSKAAEETPWTGNQRAGPLTDQEVAEVQEAQRGYSVEEGECAPQIRPGTSAFQPVLKLSGGRKEQ